jgi:hypothetical protein
MAAKIRRRETYNVVQLGAFGQRLCADGAARRN